MLWERPEKWKGGWTLEDAEDDLKRKEVQADLRRLYSVVLDRLEQDSERRLLDPKDLRLLSANVLRTIRHYMKSMGWGPVTRSERRRRGVSSKRVWIRRIRP